MHILLNTFLIYSSYVIALQVYSLQKSPRLNWATQFLTVAYDGICSPNVSVRMV